MLKNLNKKRESLNLINEKNVIKELLKFHECVGKVRKFLENAFE